MLRDELTKKISAFLDESPFDDEEIRMWKGGLSKLNESELQELFDLLKKKLEIVDEANQLFIKMAEEVAKKENKERVRIPKEFSIYDMRIQDLAELIRNNLAGIIKNRDVNFISMLDGYFDGAKLLGENVVEEFGLLIKAILENKEKLFPQNQEASKISISEWLNEYNKFNDRKNRKSIDRINFSNQNIEARKLNNEEKNELLKLLRLYDYLLHPENVLAEGETGEVLTKARQFLGPPMTEAEKKIKEIKEKGEKYSEGSMEKKVIEEEVSREKEIENLKYIANKYPVGSLERRAVEEEIGRLKVRS